MKPRKLTTPTWRRRSASPPRDGIWEMLREGKGTSNMRNVPCKNSKTKYLKICIISVSLTLLLILMGLYWPSSETRKADLIPASRKKIVTDECFTKIRFLKSSLLRSEFALRHLWQHKVKRILPQRLPTDNSLISVINHKASAHASSDTQEWTVVAALWGVLPLWKTTPSADITLSSRPITPGDCWPFRGSRGELVINLSQLMQVSAMSMEHVRPDSASSAPNRFHLYGILDNGTWIQTLVGEYLYEGPIKQFYQTKLEISSNKLKLQIISNHGNKKYTCIYRIQIYGTPI